MYNNCLIQLHQEIPFFSIFCICSYISEMTVFNNFYNSIILQNIIVLLLIIYNN